MNRLVQRTDLFLCLYMQRSTLIIVPSNQNHGQCGSDELLSRWRVLSEEPGYSAVLSGNDFA